MKKTATVPYLLFWAPGQIDWSDCNYVLDGTPYQCGSGTYTMGNAQATYSDRVAANPALMWQPVSGMKAIQNMPLLDNEETEFHLFPSRALYNGSYYDLQVDLDYEVSSETNYDYLTISSTASDLVCNSPGVVRKKVSGVQSGHLNFTISRYCDTPWIGIYYIKDGSVSANGDYARVKNVKVAPLYPVFN